MKRWLGLGKSRGEGITGEPAGVEEDEEKRIARAEAVDESGLRLIGFADGGPADVEGLPALGAKSTVWDRAWATAATFLSRAVAVAVSVGWC